MTKPRTDKRRLHGRALACAAIYRRVVTGHPFPMTGEGLATLCDMAGLVEDRALPLHQRKPGKTARCSYVNEALEAWENTGNTDPQHRMANTLGRLEIGPGWLAIASAALGLPADQWYPPSLDFALSEKGQRMLAQRNLGTPTITQAADDTGPDQPNPTPTPQTEDTDTMAMRPLTPPTPTVTPAATSTLPQPEGQPEATKPTPAPAAQGSGLSAILAQLGGELDSVRDQLEHTARERDEARKALEEERNKPRLTTAAAQAPKPAEDVREEHAHLVPSADPCWIERPEDHAVHWAARHGIPMILSGLKGGGKTSLPEQAAARLGRPFACFCCNRDTSLDDLIQRREIAAGATTVADGALAEAMRYGFVFVLDELGTSDPALMASVHDVLAKGRLRLPYSGEVLTPAAGFACFLTSNSVGQEGSENVHEGTIAGPLVDRCAVLEIPNADEATLAAIIASRLGFDTEQPKGQTIHDKSADDAMVLDWASVKAARLLLDLGGSHRDGNLDSPPSQRAAVMLGQAMRAFGGTTQGRALALRLAFLDRFPASQRDTVRGVIQRVYGV